MLKVYQHSPVAEYYLGRGLAAVGKEEDAAVWLQKSAHEYPSGEVGKRSYYELVRVFRKLQRPAEAQNAVGEYTRLREAQERQNAKQVEDWRKLGAVAEQ